MWNPQHPGAPTTDLRTQLQSAVGNAYVIERELGGGGMSRVFLATETALDRPVVFKLLPPELASGVSTDRFRQEIRLAARLQHPHIRWDSSRTTVFGTVVDSLGRLRILSAAVTGKPKVRVYADHPLEQQYRYGFAMHGGRFYIPIVDRKADVWVAEVEGK